MFLQKEQKHSSSNHGAISGAGQIVKDGRSKHSHVLISAFRGQLDKFHPSAVRKIDPCPVGPVFKLHAQAGSLARDEAVSGGPGMKNVAAFVRARLSSLARETRTRFGGARHWILTRLVRLFLLKLVDSDGG